MIFLVLFVVPVAALLWLALVSHSRWPKRIGALAAAMATVVGAATMPPLIPDELANYDITNVREASALAAAAAGSIGLVPILAAVAASLYSTQ